MNLKQITGESLGLMVKLCYRLDSNSHHHFGSSGQKEQNKMGRN